ncbi:MAG TPA: hypothetical protein VFB99_19100, partial [Vicinamibacterales bacterium]|nr:hypothetical protein [Vicinamibacterales bacterium]
FRATLTETREAALLLHVIDAGDPHHEDRRRQVETVLEDVGAAEVPCLRVYNKLDKAPADFVRELEGVEPTKFCVSAVTGEGLAALTAAIRARVSGERLTGELHLGPEQSRLRAQLFEWHAVRGETVDAAGGWTLAVDLTAQRWRQLREKEGLPADSIRQKV